MSAPQKHAVVTGGSSGIGAATVHRLSAEGYAVITGARRLERLQTVAEPVGAIALELDRVRGQHLAFGFCRDDPAGVDGREACHGRTGAIQSR